MKLWKWIIGLFAVLGGAAAIASTQKKKEHNKKVKANQDQIKAVKVKTRKVEEAKVETKKQITESKKKPLLPKNKLRILQQLKKLLKTLKISIAKKDLVVQKRKHETITINSIFRSI